MSLQAIKQLILQLNPQDEEDLFDFLKKRIDTRYNKQQLTTLLCHEDITNVKSATALLEALGFTVIQKVCAPFRVINNQLILPIHLQGAPHAHFIGMWLLSEYCRASTSQRDLREHLLLSLDDQSIEIRFRKVQELPDNIEHIFKWTRLIDGEIRWSICNFGAMHKLPNLVGLQELFLDFITAQCTQHQWQLTKTHLNIHRLIDAYDFSQWSGLPTLRIESNHLSSILSLPQSIERLSLVTRLELDTCIHRVARCNFFEGLPIVKMFLRLKYRFRESININTLIATYINHWTAPQNPERHKVKKVFALAAHHDLKHIHDLENLEEVFLAHSRVTQTPTFSKPIKTLYVMCTPLVECPQNIMRLHIDYSQWQRWKASLIEDEILKEIHIYTTDAQEHAELKAHAQLNIHIHNQSPKKQRFIIGRHNPHKITHRILRAIRALSASRIPLRTIQLPISVSLDLSTDEHITECLQLYMMGIDMCVQPPRSVSLF